MKKYLGSAAISALLAAPAFAGNLQEPVVEPIIAAPVQVQPISDWTGFYLGAQAGYGDLSSSGAGFVVDPAAAPVPETAPLSVGSEGDYGFRNTGLDLSGGLGGVHAGYMYDMGQWVLGAELDYDWADLTGDYTSQAFYNAGEDGIGLDPAGTTTHSAKLDKIGRLKLLAGYDLGDGLIYATAGAFRADIKTDTLGKLKDDGWVAGVGYKHKFTENWIGGVEGLYHKATNFDGSGMDVKIKTITARISYKF